MNTKLDVWMKAHGLCDREVALKIKISRVQVSRIRRGIHGASVKTAMRLQELTGLKWWTFVRGAQQKGKKAA
jgi:transcriptional regulator with XRE-family HTH domain